MNTAADVGVRQTVAATQEGKLTAVRKVAIASMIGSTIEWYDWVIYGVMAGVIFNEQFFPTSDPMVSLLISYGTFGAGFFARPLGAAVLGHFGDKVGRKSMLVLSLTLMGFATVLIGCLPNYAQVGIAAPAALITLRLVQGFALGGEWGGAVIMAFEYADEKQRGYYTSFPNLGLAFGLFLSSAVVALLGATLTSHEFANWGWRIAFLASAVLLAVGLFIRLQIVETPEFVAIQKSYEIAKAPIVDVFGKYPGRMILGWGARAIDGSAFTIYSIFTISYFTKTLHFDRSVVLFAIAVAAVVMALLLPAAGKWSDKTDRRKFYAAWSLVNGLIAFPVFWAMHYSGSAVVASTALVVGLGLAMAPIYGAQPALFCDLFATRVRYTGISLIYQIGGLLFVSTAPSVAVYLFALNGGAPWMTASYLAAMGLVSCGCAMMMPKSRMGGSGKSAR